MRYLQLSILLLMFLLVPMLAASQDVPKENFSHFHVISDEQKIVLHWKAAQDNGAEFTTIYRKSAQSMAERNMRDMESYAQVSVDKQVFVDTNVNPGQLYIYALQQSDKEKKPLGQRSNLRAAILADKIPPAKLPPPQATQEKNFIILKWDAAPEKDVVTYQIYRGVEGVRKMQPVRIVAANAPLFFRDKIDPKSPFAFLYAIVANDSSGNSGPLSQVVRVEVEDIRAPEKPFMTSLHPDRHKISLSWSPSPSPDVAGYNIYRSTDNWKTRLKLNKELVTLSGYADRETKFGVKYSYYVTAIDKAGNESKDSGDYSCRSIVEDKAVAPEGLKLRKNKLNTPQLHWKIMGDEVRGYLVERRPIGAKDFRQVSGLLKENTFVDTDKTSDIEIEYRLRALYKNGQISPPSDPVLWKTSRKQEREKL